MQALELLAPAKDKAVGIAAIDCGADAVYIAGPSFGNRKAAGNSLEDIRELCAYAHRFGARIFLTVNTVVYDDEWDEVHSLMLGAQEAGVDAFIFREERLLTFSDIVRPMHASTQCAIRDVERARHFEELGCARIILERGLSLQQVREICAAVSCEVEFFVHGALCVCYSGDCRLSEYLDGRSADRGDCIQACRSLYDLVDAGGRVLAKDKALLSLRDFKLLHRLGDLARAGVCSFKIEGRLKNASYVKNVVREYSLALDELVAREPGRYRRASFGKVTGGFVPDSDKTFNRGYTQWWLDAEGEVVFDGRPEGNGGVDRGSCGRASGGRRLPAGVCPCFQAGAQARQRRRLRVHGRQRDPRLSRRPLRGSGHYLQESGRPEAGSAYLSQHQRRFRAGAEANAPKRELAVALYINIGEEIVVDALSEDGRRLSARFPFGEQSAQNRERAGAMLREQLSKRSGIYIFTVAGFSANGDLPHLGAAAINSMRREIAARLDEMPLAAERPARRVPDASQIRPQPASEPELMRTRYCIKYELGLCPRWQGAAPTGPLFLVNNGRRLPLGFDCGRCEMTVLRPL